MKTYTVQKRSIFVPEVILPVRKFFSHRAAIKWASKLHSDNYEYIYEVTHQ